ncbi:MAG: hypothetical protein ABIK83_14070 [Candidatus Zixiibacteriota bacterium]
MKPSRSATMRATAFSSVLLSCLLLAATCSENGKKSGSSKGKQKPSKASKRDAPKKKPLPKFFGVYLVEQDGSYQKLNEVKEEVHRKMRPRPRIRAGTTLARAFRLLQNWRRNRWITTRYFPLTKDIPIARAGGFSKTGVLVYLENYISLHIGMSEVKKDWLVHKKKKHGWLGEEVVELHTKKLKEHVYQVQVAPAKTLPAGYYYLWIKSSEKQNGFNSGYPIKIIADVK